MAHYGIQAAVTAKTASKRSPNVEQALLTWVFENIDEKVPEGVSYEETLKDGVVLCKLMNKIKPGAIDKVLVKLIRLIILIFFTICFDCSLLPVVVPIFSWRISINF